jgi:NhaP-type Na+/H+ or K+/H+ antiporter
VTDIHKQKREEEQFTEMIVVLLFLALACIIMVYIHSRVHILEIFPESIWAIFIGIGLGMAISMSHSHGKGLAKSLAFEPHAFFLFLLPPIMFQAGFSMRTSTFFRNIVTINAFAIGATVIASFAFSFLFYYGMLESDIPFEYIDSLHFGCFISAIDPVATISIFKSMHVNDNIYMIVFGESTLNDAVAIALSSSVDSVRDMLGHGLEPNYVAVVFDSIVHFVVFFFGSLIVGCVLSLMTAYLFIKLDLEKLSWLEIGLFLQCAYMPYIVAEALNCSGILAILIAGITMRNYAFYSLSP